MMCRDGRAKQALRKTPVTAVGVMGVGECLCVQDVLGHKSLAQVEVNNIHCSVLALVKCLTWLSMDVVYFCNKKQTCNRNK